MNVRGFAAGLVLAGLVAALPTEARAQAKNIVEIAAGDARFSTLVSLVTEAGLVETLKGTGPFTVFAPTNDAFAKVDAKTLAALKADKALLTRVLTFHVVPGTFKAADVMKAKDAGGYVTVPTAAKESLKLHVAGDKIHVGDKFANVIVGDIVASNGVIHAVDAVILPPPAMAGMKH